MIYSVTGDALMVDIHVSEEIGSIGEMFNVTCSARTIPGILKSPSLTLTHPNGTSTSSAVEKELTVILDSVDVSDAGEYTCISEVVFPELNNLSLVLQARENVTLRSK